MKDQHNGITSHAKRVWLNSGVARTLFEMVGGLLLGLLLPRAAVYGGLTPFGVALTAAVTGPATVIVYLTTVIGYLLQGATASLRYLAALIVVVGIRWSVGSFERISRSLLFPAIVTFLSVLVTGSALLFGGRPSLNEAMTVICESLLGAGFAYFTALLIKELPYLGEHALSEQGRLSAVVLLAVSMIALLTVEFADISPGRIACGVAILLASRLSVRLSGGMLVGILMGVAVLLATPDMVYLAPAFSLGGLLATVFSQRGKWLSSLMYVICIGLTAVYAASEMTVLIGLYEAVAAAILFLVIPNAAETAIERIFLTVHRLPEVYASRQAVASGMEYASKSMAEVVGVVDTVSAQLTALGAPEIGGACRNGVEEVCDACKRRADCWGRHCSKLMDSLNHAVPLLRKHGSITADMLGGYLKTGCDRTTAVAEHLNAAYREFLVRESASRRLQELRCVVNDQFHSMATLLQEFSERIAQPEWVDVETEGRIRKLLQKESVEIQSVSCRVSDRGRMTVELLLAGKCQPHDKATFRRKLSQQCGRSFASPVTEYAAGVTRITFTEQSNYRVSVGVAQLACEGESLCGDAYEIFRDSEGSQLLVLSDGMGSGGRAAVDSAMAAGLAVRLLTAGFGYESMLRMINTALITKSEDESLATLDIVDINLFTGDVRLHKAGAGASLLYSKGRVTRIDDSSLPLGILRELSFVETGDRLVEGDILITMSDGVSNEGLSWVEEIVKAYDPSSGERLSELADSIAGQARIRQGEDQDDVTVLVAQLHKIA